MKLAATLALGFFGSLVGVLSSAETAKAQSWGLYDRAHAVARLDDFFVIQNEGPCVVKQSYYANPSRMELMYSLDGGLVLITPFSTMPDQIVYEVDPAGLVPQNTLARSYFRFPQAIGLPEDLVPQLQRGRTLKVMAQINGQWSHVQTFPLMGFTDAVRQLSEPPCV